MTLGSLFDGSGTCPLTASMVGIKPIWASEVEPYPIAVTKHNLPNVKHYGNISDMNGAEIEPVDIITFGSPCQDLSVAGKRAGIQDGERSNLFFQAIRIIREMRRATNGEYPRFIMWENVPGAFSSNKGHDFHTVLEAVCKVCDTNVSIPKPNDRKKPDKLVWNKSGKIVGEGYSVAWRTLDAQYWGVPQRRKRIFLVADFSGQCAGEILFKPDSLRGHFAESREARQSVAADVERGIAGGGGVETITLASSAANAEIAFNVSPCLMARAGTGGNQQPLTCYSFDSLSSNSMKSSNPHSGCREVDVSRCLDTTTPDPSKNQGGIVIALQANAIDRADTAGCNGAGWREDIGYTLNTIDRHAVCYDIGEARRRNPNEYDNLCPTISARCGTGGNNVPAVCYGQGSFAQYQENQVSTLKAQGGDPGGGSENLVAERNPPRKYIIRRLTPLECCRLQGFPDGWADIPKIQDMTDDELSFWSKVLETKAKIDGKKYKQKTKDQTVKWYNKLHTDSAEYKMWGNGMALPCVLYVMEGFADALRK